MSQKPNHEDLSYFMGRFLKLLVHVRRRRIANPMSSAF
jgi:hypothetical protein